MMQALNFTTQAIDGLMELADGCQPLSRAGVRYLCDKLRAAEVFILPDYGQLLDRSKPSPEVPGMTFRPAFPVVALEYRAPIDGARRTPGYTDCPSSKRVSLAWEWTNDLPKGLRAGENLGDGVAIASIYYSDENRAWMPTGGIAHIAFDAPWIEPTASTPFTKAVLENGRCSPAQTTAKRPGTSLVPIMPEGLVYAARHLGMEKVLDSLHADLMDEVNAYLDLSYALSCSNVGTELRRQPDPLNRRRIKRGAKPLKDFHILKLTGADSSSGRGGLGEGGSRRAHMRRGHIRQLRYLGEGRMTWVNSTMVKGKGFVDKAYAL